MVLRLQGLRLRRVWAGLGSQGLAVQVSGSLPSKEKVRVPSYSPAWPMLRARASESRVGGGARSNSTALDNFDPEKTRKNSNRKSEELY